MKEIGISEFKAKCIDELKKVQRTGEPLLVPLNKRPIATVKSFRTAISRKVLYLIHC